MVYPTTPLTISQVDGGRGCKVEFEKMYYQVAHHTNRNLTKSILQKCCTYLLNLLGNGPNTDQKTAEMAIV